MKKEKERFSRLKELLKAAENDDTTDENSDFIKMVREQIENGNPDLLSLQQESAKRGLSKLTLNRRQKRTVKSMNRHNK